MRCFNLLHGSGQSLCVRTFGSSIVCVLFVKSSIHHNMWGHSVFFQSDSLFRLSWCAIKNRFVSDLVILVQSPLLVVACGVDFGSDEADTKTSVALHARDVALPPDKFHTGRTRVFELLSGFL